MIKIWYYFVVINVLAVACDHRSSLSPRLNYTIFLHFLLLGKTYNIKNY